MAAKETAKEHGWQLKEAAAYQRHRIRQRLATGRWQGHGGPWQRRLEEIGGIKPLAFGQFGEMGPGLEALLASMAKRGADEMADRYLIEHREAASRGAGCSTCGSAGGLRCGGRKRRSSLVG
jgi:hypothetical protein